MRKLTPHEHNLIANSLRIAATTYHEAANEVAKDDGKHQRLIDQFRRQEQEALELADLFEEEA